ncbi:hypothetical protein D9M71_514240 [compost metagenome]
MGVDQFDHCVAGGGDVLGGTEAFQQVAFKRVQYGHGQDPSMGASYESNRVDPERV